MMLRFKNWKTGLMQEIILVITAEPGPNPPPDKPNVKFPPSEKVTYHIDLAVYSK